MDNSLVEQTHIDSQQMQEVLKQVVAETLKSLPQPKVPSWVEATGAFIKIHPLLSLVIVLAIFLIISAVIREVICSFLKTNEILSRLKKIEEKFKD